jgi:hypothetical protein
MNVYSRLSTCPSVILSGAVTVGIRGVLYNRQSWLSGLEFVPLLITSL